MPLLRKATIRDVAKLAKVSPSTVSMILAQKEGVTFTRETTARVYAAAKELNYQPPNRIDSKSLPNSDILLVVCPTLVSHSALLVNSICLRAAQVGYRTHIGCTTRSKEIEHSYLEECAQKKYAGCIFTFIPSFPKETAKIAEELPMVMIANRSNEANLSGIELNSNKLGRVMAQHLYELGHRHIAYLASSMDRMNTPRMHRFHGMQEYFVEQGEPAQSIVPFTLSGKEAPYYESDYEAGFSLAQQAATYPEITAMVGANDMVAFGIMDGLAKLHCKVPADYSVAGFDNTLFSSTRGMSLTTMDHGLEFAGRDAVDLLLKSIAQMKKRSQAFHSSMRIEYEPRLIVRNSTGVARTAKP